MNSQKDKCRVLYHSSLFNISAEKNSAYEDRFVPLIEHTIGNLSSTLSTKPENTIPVCFVSEAESWVADGTIYIGTSFSERKGKYLDIINDMLFCLFLVPFALSVSKGVYGSTRSPRTVSQMCK